MRSRYDQPDSDDERDWHHAMIRRTCRDCLGDVYVGQEEPWVLHVLCERCTERIERAQDARNHRGAA